MEKVESLFVHLAIQLISPNTGDRTTLGRPQTQRWLAAGSKACVQYRWRTGHCQAQARLVYLLGLRKFKIKALCFESAQRIALTLVPCLAVTPVDVTC